MQDVGMFLTALFSSHITPQPHPHHRVGQGGEFVVVGYTAFSEKARSKVMRF